MTPSLNIMLLYQLSETCSGIAYALVEKVRAATAMIPLRNFFILRSVHIDCDVLF